jgi:hypothetical protein
MRRSEPGVTAERSARCWPDATVEEIEQARKLAQVCFEADATLKIEKVSLADEPPGWYQERVVECLPA